MAKKKFSFREWFIENRIYLAAFILPVLSMLVVYFFKDIFPFGEQMYLRSDNYHQYTPYLQILKDKFSEGGSLFYTWEIGGGMNFMAIAAYYLSSPLNIILLLWPGKVVDLVSIFILLKMGLSGFTVSYYLSKKFHKKSIMTAVFGMAYALSAYFAAFSWNIMWLDCMVLLPLIAMGLERLANKGKGVMYCVTLGLAIFSNYYIGIMLCIFSVIYFIYLICVAKKPDEAKPKAKLILTRSGKFAAYSLLAGGLSACVVLPEYFNLLMTRSADTSFPESLQKYFSFLYMIFRSLMDIPVADLKYPHDPNIYCSMAVFLLIPLYFMCRKIRPKERAGKAVLMTVMLLSFSFNIPNYIWHGFHFPNSLPCRESFIYIFLILTMGYEAVLHIKEFRASQIAGSFAGAAGLIIILENLFENAEFFSDMEIETTIIKIIYLSLAFLAAYAALAFWYRRRPDLSGFILYIVVLVSFCELTINMNTTGIASTSNRKAYYESNKAFASLNETAEKDAKQDGALFYRTEEAAHRTRNDGALFGYDSISTFSSVSSAAMQYMYDALGMQTSFNAYSYYGHTPLTSSLFSIRYEYTTADPTMPSTSSLLASETYLNGSNTSVNLNLYKNNYTLPLGFMVPSGAMSSWSTDTGNPFNVQNGFIKAALPGSTGIFHRLYTDDTGSIQAYLYLEDGDSFDSYAGGGYDVYFYTPTSSENLTATITTPDGATTTKSFSSTNQHYICHVGDVSENSKITITAGDGTAVSGVQAYAFDVEAFKSAFEKLNSQGFVTNRLTDTRISGKINATETGMMFTSIPYDEGWKIYVDGHPAKATKICKDALTGVFMEAGEHEVEFKYTPKGFIPGITLTIISILIVLLIVFHERIFTLLNTKRKEKENQ